MAKLGFIGLGIMGAPMARNLIRAGHDVALWSHSAGKAEKLAATGGTAYSTPAEVARHSECVFLCVGDTKMSTETILGPEGLASGKSGPLTVVDCSTILPSASKKHAAALAAAGIDYLEAPCSGSKGGAESGTLIFMIGGGKAVFERVKPYLECMGKELFYCGDVGVGLQAKLSQNMILGNILQAFNEAFVLSTKGGVPPRLMLDIINHSAAKSGTVEIKAPLVFEGNFEPKFSVKWLEKDMDLMLQSAAELKVPTPMTAIAKKQYHAAIEKGYGEDDICGAIRVLEEQAGCEVRSPAGK